MVFRFTKAEVAEMSETLRLLNNAMPKRPIIQDLADKFTSSPARAGNPIQYKQVRTWFQNRKYSPQYRPTRSQRSHTSGNTCSDGGRVKFEAKSATNGAWYDVDAFLSLRFAETGDEEVRARFAGFGPKYDEWVNVRKCVRLRSIPCEGAQCAAVVTGDRILCYKQVGKEQALHFDAVVLNAKRRTHYGRECPCTFLVRYDHDYSEEIVPLRNVCRRPETRAASSADIHVIVIDHRAARNRAQKPHKMINQGGVPAHQTKEPAAPLLLLAAPNSTRTDSVADVQIGDAEAAPKVEAASKAPDQKMNVGA